MLSLYSLAHTTSSAPYRDLKQTSNIECLPFSYGLLYSVKKYLKVLSWGPPEHLIRLKNKMYPNTEYVVKDILQIDIQKKKDIQIARYNLIFMHIFLNISSVAIVLHKMFW